MSYQAYLNNIGLQQSLQDTFAQAQTTNDQDAFEEVEDDNENKTARGDTMKEEKEQADEEGAIGLSTALIPALDITIGGSTISSLANQAIGSVTSAAKSAVSDVVDSVGESISTGISAGLQTGKAFLSEAAEGIQNQLGAFAENAKNVFGSSTTDYSSRIGSTDQEYLLEGDPEVSEAIGASSVRAVAPDAAEAAVPTAETLGTTTATVAGSEAATVATGATTAAVVGAEAGGEAAAGGLAALAPEIAVGADIPFLNIGIALAGVGYGLYELFHHSSAPPAPPPPPAPLAVAQNVSTTQVGV
jgi:uncharacterized protein (DUF2147 family)